jgi:hypothetical protein
MGRLIAVGVAKVLLLVAYMAPASAQESLPPGPQSATPPFVHAGPSSVATKPGGRSVAPLFRAAQLLTTAQLRSGPRLDDDLVQVIPEGNIVGVARCAGGWCAVLWKGRRGFVTADALRMAPPRSDGSYPAYNDLMTAYHGGASDDNGPPNFTWAAFVGVGYGPNSHPHHP